MTFFFDDDIDVPAGDEPELERRPWWGPSAEELPAIVPASGVIATSEHVAIALLGLHVHRDGVELRVERRLRRGGLSARDWQSLVEVFMEHSVVDEPAQRLRYGLVLPDGARVLEGGFRMPSFDPMAEPEGASLVRNGGGGGGGGSSYSSSEQLWLWPLPPGGVLELVLQWGAVDIAESRIAVDLTGLQDLVARVVPLWQQPAVG